MMSPENRLFQSATANTSVEQKKRECSELLTCTTPKRFPGSACIRSSLGMESACSCSSDASTCEGRPQSESCSAVDVVPFVHLLTILMSESCAAVEEQQLLQLLT